MELYFNVLVMVVILVSIPTCLSFVREYHPRAMPRHKAVDPKSASAVGSGVETVLQEEKRSEVYGSDLPETDRRITWKAAVRSEAKVKESQRKVEEYMALPASEYSVLSADQIERLSDTQFKATLGKLNFFGKDFIPILYVDVDVIPEEARSEIKVNKAETTGSDMAEKISGTFDIVAKNMVSTGMDKKGRKVLISDTTLAIDVIVPAESRIPLRIINSGGNFVIQQSLNLIVPTFIRLLAFDFRRWSAGENKRDALEGASLN
jgi:hypothetical protein